MNEGETKKFFERKGVWLGSAALVIVLGAVGAFVALEYGGSKKSQGGTATAESSAPSSTCEAALARVRDYGVVPFDSTLSGDADGKKRDDGHIECGATSGEETYSMLVDLTCDDLSNENCLEIYRVTEGNGTSLFQKRPYSF